MKNIVLTVFVVFAVELMAAVPVIREGSVKMAQTGGHGKVNIEYVLDGAPGIVTMDVQTNAGENVWVSIGGAAFVNGLSGDVGHAVSTGFKKIYWDVRKTWPDRVVEEGGIRTVLKAWATNAPPDYLVVDLTKKNVHWFCEDEDKLPCGPISSEAAKTRYLVMKRVQASGVRWVMGMSPQVKNRLENHIARSPTKLVTLTSDYYMGVYEFTQGQFTSVGCNWADNFKYPTLKNFPLLPMLGFTWTKIRGNINWPSAGTTVSEAHQVGSSSLLGAVRERTGIEFDLPTEAQWEFACRAGTEGPLYNGKELGFSGHDPIAWIKYNTPEVDIVDVSGNSAKVHVAQPVGGKEPNGWGFYDMIGNIREFCLDVYSENGDGLSEAVDPKGAPLPESGSHTRICRGGATATEDTLYNDEAIYGCSAAHRASANPNAAYYYNGLRVICPVTLKW